MSEEQTKALTRALATLKELRARLESVEQARTEPIAVIGMGCRFPGGADSPAAFWRLLTDAVDAVGETPADRWDADALYAADPDAPGKVSTRGGAFLENVDAFDPYFFGISPREAAAMDPQQRLLLEVAWEALADAGQATEALRGSRTGVFVGVHSHSNDYFWLAGGAPASMDYYLGTGTAHNVLSGRLSYLLDARGPALAVDTACSSSLVAVHLACNSLRSGESNLALVGGVNLMLSPLFAVAASRMRVLSADGRCKTFDARADGFGRGEGCGVVVLKRLSDARADRDPVRAIIRGSAVNQDGHSNGLAAPNGPAQQAVIREALANGHVAPADITYVETHGTGTPLGDPIEVEALANELGAGPRPCVLGAVKTNIGHLEGAAGIAGLIKTVLALQHNRIPANLHFQRLNPHINLAGTRLEIADHARDWISDGGPRYAGVSSFGWSGTNAHLVLESASAAAPAATAQAAGPRVLCVSARAPAALRSLAQEYRNVLANPVAGLDDICYTANVRRSHYDHRLAVAGRSAPEMVAGLDAFLRGESPANLATGRQGVPAPGLVFVFSGQGGQWPGMARQLLKDEPVFRTALERCATALQPQVGWSLLELLAAGEANARLKEIDVIQPVLFAIQIGLAEMWRAWGIEPDAVVGHSLGEVAAAHVAGALSLEDAGRVIVERSALLRRIAGQGAMAVVGLAFDEARAAIAGREHLLAVGVSNSPRSCVLSGDPVALDQVLGELRARDVFCRAVQVDVASHSPQVEPLCDELRRRLANIAPRASAVPMYSTVTGEIIEGEKLDADYWASNLRRPVLFARATQNLLAAGHSLYIEQSPHPILLTAIEETLAEANAAGHVVASLRRGEDEALTLRSALGQVYATGRDVDWRRASPAGCVVPLPCYPWQHQRYWLDRSALQTETVRGTRDPHPLLGVRLDLASGGEEAVWEIELDEHAQPDLVVHRLHGAPVVAATTYVEMARLAASRLFAGEECVLTGVEFERALVLTADQVTRVQIVAVRGASGTVALAISSRSGDTWQSHFKCTIQREGIDPAADSLVDLRARCVDQMAGADFYKDLETRGARFAESLHSIRQVARGDHAVVAELAGAAPGESRFTPAQLDAGFQLLGALTPDRLDVPVRAERVRFYGRSAGKLWAQAQELDGRVDLGLVDDAGRALVEIDGVELRSLEQESDGLFKIRWQDCPRPGVATREGAGGEWLIVADASGVGAALAARIQAQGGRATVIHSGADWRDLLTPPAAWRGIVYLSALDAPADLDAATVAAAPGPAAEGAVRLVQDLARTEWQEPPRVWFVTRGGQAVEPGDCPQVLQSAVWGLARVIAVEHREFWGGLIDLDPLPDPAQAAEQLQGEIVRPDGEDQVAFRSDRRCVPRLVSFDGAREPFARWRTDAAYLITGGLGGIGAEVARGMARQGARHLILAGRTPLPSRESWAELQDARQIRFAHTIRDLEALGASVTYAPVDVADETQLAAFVAAYRREGRPPIRGVVHAAGVIDDRLITELDAASLRAVMRPKLGGGLALQRVFAGEPLDFFVLFSSVGALVGQAGQGNYAAANAALDALAHDRRGRGQVALSINWGAWSGLGFAATAGGRRVIEQLEERGLASMSARQGVHLLHRLLTADVAQVAVMPVQRARIIETSRLFGELAGGTPVAAAPPTTVRDELAARDPAQRRAFLQAYVQTTLGQVLHLAPGQIELHTPLGSYGIESLSAIEFRNRLEAGLGLRLSATIVWNHPTVADLVVFLAGKLGAPLEAPPRQVPPATPAAPRDPAQGDLVATRVNAMSDAEVMRELRKRRKGRE